MSCSRSCPSRRPELALASLVLVLVGCAATAPRPLAPGPAAGDRLFGGHALVGLELEFDQGAVFRERSGDSTYHPARMRYAAGDGAVVELELQVRTRGNFRRDWQICPFPPLRLNFAKKQVEGTLFSGQDKLKLVTHCDRRNEQYVLQEYLLYRAYNLLTERSFRVRLVDIAYRDAGGRSEQRYAFFIEDIEHVAERNGFVEVEQPEIPRESLDPDELALMELFQYMAGNTDFSVLRGAEGEDCCHNTVPMRAPDGRMVAVPYDFDLAGAVNAPYALPDAELGQRSVRQRVYRGLCRPPVHLERAIARVQGRRADLYALYESEVRLDARQRRSARDYLDRFYEAVSDPDRMHRDLLERCRG